MRRRIVRISSASVSTERSAEWTVWLTDDDEIRALNQRFRGQDRTTDVLSFPLGPWPAELAELAGGPTELLLGDVFISVEQAERQAPERELEPELLRLVVHGLCHLRGHDHQRAGDARRMRLAEEELLAAIGVELGLVTRAARVARAALLAVAALAAAGSACASGQRKLDTLDAPARARFSACQADVLRQLCPAGQAPADGDCSEHAASIYAGEEPTERRRWLIDLGCSREALDGAERALRRSRTD
ncbi:MAG: rRNA maturation RNase YbeY [Proteobacteria bacterium]|nr:rRNA maturation RNase YbeY [Pseudomonadota bacterium]